MRPRGKALGAAHLRRVSHMTAAVLCVALAVYFEARGEPATGQRAVAEVVLNRVWRSNGKRDACDVVFREDQFQWTKRLKPRHWPKGYAWNRARSVATTALRERALDAIDGRRRTYAWGATHFHADTVCPPWATALQYVGTIGGHFFYRSLPRGESPRGPAPCVPAGIDPN